MEQRHWAFVTQDELLKSSGWARSQYLQEMKGRFYWHKMLLILRKKFMIQSILSLKVLYLQAFYALQSKEKSIKVINIESCTLHPFCKFGRTRKWHANLFSLTHKRYETNCCCVRVNLSLERCACSVYLAETYRMSRCIESAHMFIGVNWLFENSLIGCDLLPYSEDYIEWQMMQNCSIFTDLIKWLLSAHERNHLEWLFSTHYDPKNCNRTS